MSDDKANLNVKKYEKWACKITWDDTDIRQTNKTMLTAASANTANKEESESTG